jgi:hypothetical protein
MNRRPINSFGRTYDYLKDVDLRLKEIDKKRITIENAEFAGEEFINGYWGYCDFVNCHFPASHNIQLIQTVGCNFVECEFGPSRDDDSIQFGECRDTVFKQCKVLRGSLVFEGKAQFDACEFDSLNSDPNHRHILIGDDTTLNNCKASHYTWRGDNKLTVSGCTFGVGRLSSGLTKNVSDDFKIIDSTFENAEKIFWATKVKNLTISRCVAEGSGFFTQGCNVDDTMTLEHLSRGYFDTLGGSPKKKLIVRDCYFRNVGGAGFYFRCIGGYSKETLIERVSALDNKAPVNFTGAGEKATEKIRFPKTQNDLFIVRDCKIPHLKINWLQSACFRLENCKIGQLEIRDGRIDRLEIKNTEYESLDISRTIVDDYAIERLASGVIIDTGSNYDSATGKARKK